MAGRLSQMPESRGLRLSCRNGAYFTTGVQDVSTFQFRLKVLCPLRLIFCWENAIARSVKSSDYSRFFHICSCSISWPARPAYGILLYACCQRIFRKNLTSLVLARYNMRNERRWCVNGPTTTLHRQCDDYSHLPVER